MDTGNSKRMTGKVRRMLTGFSIRTRIAFSILLAFVVVLPVVVLSLVSFSNLTSAMHRVTEQDVRIGRICGELASIMRDVARTERNYRIFGDPTERAAVENLIAQEDSILAEAERIVPASERDAVRDLDRKLDRYRNSFSFLILYREKNPATGSVRTNTPALAQRLADFESVLWRIRLELRNAAPAQRDSLLAEADRHIDLFALDLASGAALTGGRAAQLSGIQNGLDTARNDFIRAADDFAALNWARMTEDREDALRIDARAKRNIIFVLILTAMVSFLMFIRLPIFIVRPITGLSTMLRRAASGELDTSAPISSRDEIGALATSYNQAIERLRSYDDLKTKKISSQKRSIDRLIDYLNVPVCIMSKNQVALYYNSLFAGLFGSVIPHRAPDNGVDLTKLPELQDFVEQIRKRTAQAGGDFRFSIVDANGTEIHLKGRPVRNVALNIETLIVIGDDNDAVREG